MQSLNSDSERILRPKIQSSRAYCRNSHGDHFTDSCFGTTAPVLKILKQSYDSIRLSNKISNVYKMYLVIELYRCTVSVFLLEKMTIYWHVILDHIFFFLDSIFFPIFMKF